MEKGAHITRLGSKSDLETPERLWLIKYDGSKAQLAKCERFGCVNCKSDLYPKTMTCTYCIVSQRCDPTHIESILVIKHRIHTRIHTTYQRQCKSMYPTFRIQCSVQHSRVATGMSCNTFSVQMSLIRIQTLPIVQQPLDVIVCGELDSCFALVGGLICICTCGQQKANNTYTLTRKNEHSKSIEIGRNTQSLTERES